MLEPLPVLGPGAVGDAEEDENLDLHKYYKQRRKEDEEKLRAEAEDEDTYRAQDGYAEEGEKLVCIVREERNPGSEGHPDSCKKPCNKYIREKPSSCKHGDECGYCHENHNKPKHKGQRGRYAQQRREFLESQNNDPAFTQNINRIYKEVHEECDNLKRWLLYWKQVSEGTILNRVLDELRQLGEDAQKARPDRARMQSTKAASVSSSQTLNLSDVEGRCKWLIGTMHLMVRKRWEELNQFDEAERPVKQEAVQAEVSKLLQRLHDLGNKVEKHNWTPIMTGEELFQLIREMFPDQSSSSSSSSSKAPLVKPEVRLEIEEKAAALSPDLGIFEYEPLKEYFKEVSETRAAADLIDRLDFCLQAVEKKKALEEQKALEAAKKAEEEQKALEADGAEEAQAEEARAEEAQAEEAQAEEARAEEAQADEAQADEAEADGAEEAQADEAQAPQLPRPQCPYAIEIQEIVKDKLTELEKTYRDILDGPNAMIHIQNEYVIDLLLTKTVQLFPPEGGSMYRCFDTIAFKAFINESDSLVDLDKRFEWCRKLLVDDLLDAARREEDSGEEDSGDEQLQQATSPLDMGPLDIRQEDYNRTIQAARELDEQQRFIAAQQFQ